MKPGIYLTVCWANNAVILWLILTMCLSLSWDVCFCLWDNCFWLWDVCFCLWDVCFCPCLVLSPFISVSVGLFFSLSYSHCFLTSEVGRTTVECRDLPLALIVALDSNGGATGELYWDDGESEDLSNGKIIQFTATDAGKLLVKSVKSLVCLCVHLPSRLNKLHMFVLF